MLAAVKSQDVITVRESNGLKKLIDAFNAAEAKVIKNGGLHSATTLNAIGEAATLLGQSCKEPALNATIQAFEARHGSSPSRYLKSIVGAIRDVGYEAGEAFEVVSGLVPKTLVDVSNRSLYRK